MSPQEKQQMKVQMQKRREQASNPSASSAAEDSKQGEQPVNFNAAQSSNHGIHEPPAQGLEAMMGLDDMGEMEIPAHLLPGGGGFDAGGGMSEDDMIAAAIQASLQDMSLNEAPSNSKSSSNQPSNQISQESYDFLNSYAGGGGGENNSNSAAQAPPTSQNQQTTSSNSNNGGLPYRDPYADCPFDKDPFNVGEEPQAYSSSAAAAQQQQYQMQPVMQPVMQPAMQPHMQQQPLSPPQVVAHDLIDISEPASEQSAFDLSPGNLSSSDPYAVEEESKMPSDHHRQ